MTNTQGQSLFRLRVRYVKQGRLRYLGHLEVLHTIERVVRRAQLPYAVTQGFSPHMRAGFSSALPVGTASRCEWFDIFLTELVPTSDALARLRAAAPRDLAPADAGYVDVRAAALTAFITCATYTVELQFNNPAPALDIVQTTLDDLRAQGGIDFLRGQKQKHLDLSHTLAAATLELVDERTMRLTLDTRMDNDGALRPEVLIAALDVHLAGTPDIPIQSTGVQRLARIDRYQVERIDQYALDRDGNRKDPL